MATAQLPWNRRKGVRFIGSSSVNFRPSRVVGVPVVMHQLHVLVLPAERSQVQVLVAAAEQVDDREIAGVRVQDGVAVAVEEADAALLAGTCGPGLAPVDQLAWLSLPTYRNWPADVTGSPSHTTATT